MAGPQAFEDLESWGAARHLAKEVYLLCRRDPLARDFGLCDQLRRAAVSVMNMDNNFVTASELDALRRRCVRTGKLVSGLIRSLNDRL
ncbi:MAG: four helix bundle protein [Verrucomicrobiales bacterium]|nr:four helix bundle protein [Verrucomicrobiales bacterium]